MNYTLNDVREGIDMLSRYQDTREVFETVIDLLLLDLRQEPTTEQEWVGCLTKLYAPDAGAILPYLGTAIATLSQNYRDPLGQIYTDDVSHGQMGQFFTPEHLCTLVSELVWDSIPTQKEGVRTVLDCACGSGRLLLASAQQNKNCLFFGADLDLLCCKMTLYNFLTNCMVGEVAHINSLTNEFFGGYITSVRKEGNRLYPFFIPFNDPARSLIHLKEPGSGNRFHKAV